MVKGSARQRAKKAGTLVGTVASFKIVDEVAADPAGPAAGSEDRFSFCTEVEAPETAGEAEAPEAEAAGEAEAPEAEAAGEVCFVETAETMAVLDEGEFEAVEAETGGTAEVSFAETLENVSVEDWEEFCRTHPVGRMLADLDTRAMFLCLRVADVEESLKVVTARIDRLVASNGSTRTTALEARGLANELKERLEAVESEGITLANKADLNEILLKSAHNRLDRLSDRHENLDSRTRVFAAFILTIALCALIRTLI